jgi:UDP-galactopyranose mutase
MIYYLKYPANGVAYRIQAFERASCSGTFIVREYSQSGGEPYYPIPIAETDELYRRYNAMIESDRNVHFVERLARNKYYNMGQVVASAMKCVERVIDNNQSGMESIQLI